MEPPFLLRHRVALAKWKPVLEALEDVTLQTSAMESVLEGQGQCNCMPQEEESKKMQNTWMQLFAAMHAHSHCLHFVCSAYRCCYQGCLYQLMFLLYVQSALNNMLLEHMPL